VVAQSSHPVCYQIIGDDADRRDGGSGDLSIGTVDHAEK
jgi:hypothetical protein